MKTSLGIWAFGAMATRFNPGGYKPDLAGASTVSKVRTAVEGLGDLMDDYEFHYPQELSPDNLEDVRQALDGHGIYCVASGLHLDPRFGKGAFASPNDATRSEALRLTREAIDLAAEVGGQMIIWPGIEGYNYPFQTPYAESWARFVDGEITPRFPDGLTVFNTVGQWRDSERKTIVREPSKIVMIVLPGKDDDIDRLNQIAEAYKSQFRQQSVAVMLRPACVSF